MLTAALAAVAAAAVVAGGAAANGLSGTMGDEAGPGDWIDGRGLLVTVVMVVVMVGVGKVVVADRSVLLTGIVTVVINWRFLLGTTGLVAVTTPGPEASTAASSAATGACGATISVTVGVATMASVIAIVVVLDEGDGEMELDDDGGEGG